VVDQGVRSSFSTETEEQDVDGGGRSARSSNDSYSDDYSSSSERGQEVSNSSSSEASSGSGAADKRHEEAVRREEDRVFQRNLYHENKGFDYNVDTANAIKRVLKEYIFPKIKILSGREHDYLTPDFVGDSVDQSRLICEKLINELDMPNDLEDKIRFWIGYRKLVKNQLVKYRSNCVEDLKKEYFKGEFFNDIHIVLIYCNVNCTLFHLNIAQSRNYLHP
jgi:hypothetical protein